MTTSTQTQTPDATSRAALRAEMRRMRAEPTGLERPIVVLSGWRSMGMERLLGVRLRRLTGAGEVLSFAYPLAGDIVPIARRVARRTGERFGAEREVDVVAISMGGLVARAAATSMIEGPHRLKIRRLFTLGTPHRGACLAARVRVDRASRDMRPGSAFLARLDEELARAPYEIVAYAALDDWMVGATNCAPPGSEPIWFRGLPLVSHHTISSNLPIVVDVARRLRGEAPIAEPSRPPRD